MATTNTPVAEQEKSTPRHAGRKVDALLDVGDMAHCVGILLREEIDPAFTEEKLSKSKRNEYRRKLKLAIDTLLGTQGVVQKSTGRLSPLKQKDRAHAKKKAEKKRRIEESLLSSTRRSKKSRQELELTLFYNEYIAAAAEADAATKVSGGNAGDTMTKQRLFNSKTRAAANDPGPIQRLPQPKAGKKGKYSPQEIVYILLSEEALIEDSKNSGAKGVKAMQTKVKEMKQYLIDKKRVGCDSTTNINRLFRTYKDNPNEAPV